MSILLWTALSLLIAMTTIAAMLFLGRAGPLDLPNDRSLHVTPVPRSGGVGILGGVTMGIVAVRPEPILLVGLTLLVLVSWWDDRSSLPVGARFVGHFVAAGLAIEILPEWGLLALTAALLSIVWMTNLYNFMDGANGLAGGMAVVGFGAYAIAAGGAGQESIATWAACIAAAAAGFLVFNFDPARIFMGDVGSIPLGFLAAVLGLDGIRLEVWPFWFPLLVFSPFIVDATMTLLKRALLGKKIWQAHREHYYQRLVCSGWNHRRLAFFEYALMTSVATSALLMLYLPSLAQCAGLLFWLAAYFVLTRKIDSLGLA